MPPRWGPPRGYVRDPLVPLASMVQDAFNLARAPVESITDEEYERLCGVVRQFGVWLDELHWQMCHRPALVSEVQFVSLP